MAETLVGISGWTYAPWRGIFYPPKLPQRLELSHASRQVTSIEVNGTFYRLQSPDAFRQWAAETPARFTFAVKAPRYITHVKRLKDCERPLANFLASGLLCLGKKLGPILWQLPPNLPYADDRIVRFMELLPHTMDQAGELAKQHDEMVEGAAHTEAEAAGPVRHAFEFRHESCADAGLLAEMRRLNIALVLTDSGEHTLPVDDVTADFVYVRMHGQKEFAEDGYTDEALAKAAERTLAWRQGKAAGPKLALAAAPITERDVYIYFDNDAKAYAPRDARRLLERLGLAPKA